MLTEELRDKLAETRAICDLHHERMMFAWGNIKKYFPLTEIKLSQVSPIELALFDQLIYRFSKLQDSMGSRLFKQLLEHLKKIFQVSHLLTSFINWKSLTFSTMQKTGSF